MSCEYFLAPKPPCQSCGRPHQRLQIGTSAVGWAFGLNLYPSLGINDLADWVVKWKEPGAEIFDEYGKQISPDEMISRIAGRSFPGGLNFGDESRGAGAWTTRKRAEGDYL